MGQMRDGFQGVIRIPGLWFLCMVLANNEMQDTGGRTNRQAGVRQDDCKASEAWRWGWEDSSFATEAAAASQAWEGVAAASG